jgi:hypothetical protein
LPDSTFTLHKPGIESPGAGGDVRPATRDDVIRRAHEAFVRADIATSPARVSKLVRRALRYRTPAELVAEVDSLVEQERARREAFGRGRPTLNVGTRGGVRSLDPTGEAAIWRVLLGGGA